MKKNNKERAKDVYAAYMRAADDMFSILKELVDKDGVYSPQYDERINAFDKLSRMANKYRDYFPKPQAWYEKDMHLRASVVGEALCDYYLQQDEDIDFREPFFRRVEALYKELVNYVPYIRSKKNILWDCFINLNFLLSRELDKMEEDEESAKYYERISKYGPYGNDDNNRRWVEIAMLEQYYWVHARKDIFATKKTCLRHIERTEQILSVHRSLLRRKMNKNEDACSWIELEILWILEGLAQWADLHNRRVSYLYDLWRIGQKDEVLRDHMKEDIAAFLIEIPHEKLDIKHAKQRIKVLKELSKYFD